MPEIEVGSFRAVIRHVDGKSSSIRVCSKAIVFDETRTRPIGVVVPHATLGDEFVQIQPIIPVGSREFLFDEKGRRIIGVVTPNATPGDESLKIQPIYTAKK